MRGRRRGRCSEDCIPDAFDIFDHFVVPETEHAIAAFQEPSITHDVAVVFGVLAAIKFDHESFLSTDKIDNIIRPDRLLADELNPASDRERKYRQSFCSARVE